MVDMLASESYMSSNVGTVGESGSEMSALTSTFKPLSPDNTISPSKTVTKLGAGESINQRCDMMLSEQLTHLSDIQAALVEVLNCVEEGTEREKNMERAAVLFDQAEHGSVLVSVISKMQNELFYARHELQRLITTPDRDLLLQRQDRVKWLENRIEQVLLLHRQSVLESKRDKMSSQSSEDVLPAEKENTEIFNIGDLVKEDTVTTNVSTRSVKSHKSKAASTGTTRFTIPSTAKSEELIDTGGLWGKKTGHQPLWHTLPLVPRSPIAISCLPFDKEVPWLDRKGSSYDLLREEYSELMVKVEKVYNHIQLVADNSHELDVNINSPSHVSSRMSRNGVDGKSDYDCYGLDPPLPLKWSRLSRAPTNVYPRPTKTWHKGVYLTPVRRIANQSASQPSSRPPSTAQSKDNTKRAFNRSKLEKAKAKVKLSVLASVSLQKLNKNLVATRQAVDEKTGLVGAQRSRLQFLIENNLKSDIDKVRKEAAKDLGVLYKTQPSYAVINALKESVYTDRNIFVLIEASRSLLNIGVWDTAALEILIQSIKYGSQDLRCNLLETLRTSTNPHLINKQSVQFRVLHSLLLCLMKKGSHLIPEEEDNKTQHFSLDDVRSDKDSLAEAEREEQIIRDNDKLASLAALVCACFDIREEAVQNCLMYFLENGDEDLRSWSLQALTKSLSCHSEVVIRCCLDQMKTAIRSENRAAAARLIVEYKSSIEDLGLSAQVFDDLQQLLYDDSSRDVKKAVAKAVNILGLHSKMLQVVIRKLDDINEDVRAQGVMSLSILGIKGKSLLNQLLDILELDSSIYVRIQVMRAVKELNIGDRRVIRLLRERARGGGPMCTEAQTALYALTGDIE